MKFLERKNQEHGLAALGDTGSFALLLHLGDLVESDGHLLIIIDGQYPYTTPRIHLHNWLPPEENAKLLRDLVAAQQRWTPALDLVKLLAHFGEAIAQGDPTSITGAL